MVRIGVLDQTTRGWSAGRSFTWLMLRCLALAKDARSDLVFLSRSNETDFTAPFPSIYIGEFAAETYPEWQKYKDAIREQNLNVVLPVRDVTYGDIECPFVGWVPDIQHILLPSFFLRHDIEAREMLCRSIFHRSTKVILSSESVKQDCEKFYPQYAAKMVVVNFPSILWDFDSANDSNVIAKYHLPEKFAMVANQFWRHKNHRVIPSAMGILKRSGIEMNLVVTGLPIDYRDFDNQTVSRFLQDCASEGVGRSVHFLGGLPFKEMVSIMRHAALIIQPSFFEGWSTSVEDSKALGRPLVCSDIPVHREQAPNAIGFFEARNSKSLAGILAKSYPELPAGPDRKKEGQSLELNRTRSTQYGKKLLEIAHEVAGL